jgi:molecular chaperone DnaJ
MKDYYSILGVDENTSPNDIKQTYRQLAHKYHPDRNPGDIESENKFKSISEAYQVLTDPHKRQQYDQVRQGDFSVGVGDLFESMFAGFGFDPSKRRKRQQPTQTPGNAIVNIEVSLDELESGKTYRAFDVSKNVLCKSCEGIGGDSMNICETCQGQGNLIQEVHHGGVHFQATTVCRHCQGKGQRIIKPCSNCRGTGIVTQKNAYKITLISEKL